MALDSWLSKVKSTISTRLTIHPNSISILPRKKANVGILAFEIASLMSKILHLWRSLSDNHISHLRDDSITMEGVRKIVSDDDAFLLGLVSAELTQTLRSVAESTAALCHRCSDPAFHHFWKSFNEFADTGRDCNRWVLPAKEMEAKVKRMDRHVIATAALYKEMDELTEAEHVLKKLLQSLPASKISSASEAQQKVFWQRQELKYLKQTSLWSCTIDTAISLLARSTFTVLARIKHVFVGVGPEYFHLPRSLSVSSAVYPSSDPPLSLPKSKLLGFFDSSSAKLSPPATTLGAAGLALHYANVIVSLERMIRSPRAVGSDVRDELYAMLPVTVRGLLRTRLRGVGWAAARDGRLASEWRSALGRIMGWLAPMAHNTIRWQGERSFERRSASAPRGSVLLLQTLFFANQQKVEAAVAELLVGLNYVWRFEVAMSAEVLMMKAKCEQL